MAWHTTKTINNYVSSTQNTTTTTCWAYLVYAHANTGCVSSPSSFDRNATTKAVYTINPYNVPVYVRA